MNDPVNPSHYKDFLVSPIDLIKAYSLGFEEGNVIKYTARAKHKNGSEDLLKAAWYLSSALGLSNQDCESVVNNIRSLMEKK